MLEKFLKSWQVVLFWKFSKEFSLKWAAIIGIPFLIIKYYKELLSLSPSISVYLQPYIEKVFGAKPPEGEVSMVSYLVAIIIFLVWFIIANFKITCQQAKELTPSVDLTFLDDTECVLLTPLTDRDTGKKVGEAYYIRAKVINEHHKMPEILSAQLVNVEIKKGDIFIRTNFRTPLKIGPGCPFYVQKYVPEYLNICWIHSTDNKVHLGSTLNEYNDIFSEIGLYRLTIQISEGGSCCRISLGFNWQGKYERPTITLYGKKQTYT